jgi:hypothetical protein
MRPLAALLTTLSLAAALPAAALGPPAPAAPVATRVLVKLDEALELAFPGCEVARGTEYLTEAQREAIEELAGTPADGAIVHPYVATRDGALVGTAYVDTHRVRTLRESVLVVVDPAGRIGRVEVLAFGEPEDYLPRGRWYDQFLGRPLDDELSLKRAIRGISGATLTAHATTDAVRRALALHSVLAEAPEPEPQRGSSSAP